MIGLISCHAGQQREVRHGPCVSGSHGSTCHPHSRKATALWPVPSYTAWWQRHIGVWNLPRVFTPWCTAETRTATAWSQVRHYTATPRRHLPTWYPLICPGGSLVRAAIQPNPGLGKKLRIMVDRLLTIYKVRVRVRVRVREVNQHKWTPGQVNPRTSDHEPTYLPILF